ncbi:cytochrome D1 domain-containing protein [Ignatzschineria sp. LJL83]
MIVFYVITAVCGFAESLRGTGDLGVIIERADGSVLIVEHTDHQPLSRIEGLGDLSHASVVFSRDARYAYVFGRDGGLTKIDLLKQQIDQRIIQGGNSIGGAISQDGRLIAVGNYEPGGVKIFDAKTLDEIISIPATPIMSDGEDKYSRVVGMVDAPDNKFIVTLFDTGEIWVLDFSEGDYGQLQTLQNPQITRYENIGKQPYDAMITSDGRYYIAGLFGEDGLALLDLWQPEQGVSRILNDYGRGGNPLPVYKMPHLEGWTVANDSAFFPAVGYHQTLIVNSQTWEKQGAIDMIGQPVFVMARPDARQVWVNFAFPDNQYIQVIDTLSQKIIKTLEPGPGILHMEFTPRGEHIWISVRDKDEVQIWDTRTLKQIDTVSAKSPSGIFFTNRAHQIGL